MFSRLSLGVVCAVFAAIGTVGIASASQISVSPIQVQLSNGTHTSVVTVTNHSDEPVRVQITGFAWKQLPNGGMQLAQTDDLVFFPQMLTLGAGEKRSLRVASTADATDAEKTYRLFVEELPSLDSQLHPGANELVIRTKFGLPVFLTPAHAFAKPEIANAQITHKRLAFDVVNTGTQHLMITGVNVVGKSMSGTRVFDVPLTGWYVLAGGDRQFSLPLEKCGQVDRVDILVQTSAGSVTKPLDNANAACR